MVTKTLGYSGNPNLKKIGADVQWTPSMLEEWVKCRDDIVYFTRNYIKIIHVDKGMINFLPFDFQEQIIETVHDNRFTILNCSRQSGKCLIDYTSIQLRNKTTGEIVQTEIGEFFDKIKSYQN